MKASLSPPTQRAQLTIPNWLLMILICELGLLVVVGFIILFGAMTGLPIVW